MLKQTKKCSKIEIDEGMKSEALTCSICLEDLSVESIAIQLSCSHLYHEECIVKWLDRSNTCPSCHRIVSDFSS